LQRAILAEIDLIGGAASEANAKKKTRPMAVKAALVSFERPPDSESERAIPMIPINSAAHG